MASSVSFNKNDIAYPKVLADKLNKLASDSGGSENREIKVDGNDFLGGNTTPLNITHGTNINLTKNSSTGVLTINSTVVNTDTHRPIKVDGNSFLGNNTTALDIVHGTHISFTKDTANGKLTINSTAVSSDTHRPIKINGGDFLGDNTTALNLSGGTNISLSYTSTSPGKVTINADIPKASNQLIYYNSSSANTAPYNGLFTQQVMYEDAIVVSNETDYNYCKSRTSTNIILRTYDNTVYQKNGSSWLPIIGKTPLDYFKGSRLSMNSYTQKLFYSNGSRIYQIAGSFDD